MKPKLVCRSYTGADGLNQVAVYYTHKGKILYLDTGVRVNSKNFTGTSITSKEKDYEKYNTLLRNSMNKVESIILKHLSTYQLEPTIDFLRTEYFKEGERQHNEVSVISLFDNWIKDEKSKKIKNIKLYI